MGSGNSPIWATGYVLLPRNANHETVRCLTYWILLLPIDFKPVFSSLQRYRCNCCFLALSGTKVCIIVAHLCCLRIQLFERVLSSRYSLALDIDWNFS